MALDRRGLTVDGIAEFVTSPVEAVGGWTWDGVVGGMTRWMAKGFVELLSFVWAVMDAGTSPRLDAEWFSGSPSSPYAAGAGVAAVLLLAVLLCALIQGVMAGQPMELVRRMFRDAPAAVAGILFTAALTQVAVEFVDQVTDGIWGATRPNAVAALDSLGRVALTLGAQSFLAALLLLVGMLALLLLWVVLVVRESLIYVVVALSPLAWAASVWPALVGVRRRCLELLAGLVVSKIAIALALAVGVGALGGLGATGTPGAGVAGNAMAEYSTLVVGVVTFGLAGFMPFVVVKLLPILEGAAVGQGIASGPVRTAQSGMQYSYYAEGIRRRLSRGGPGGGEGGDGGPEPDAGTPRSPGTGSTAATSPVGGASPTGGDGAGASAAGAAGPAGAAAAAGGTATGAAKDQARRVAGGIDEPGRGDGG